MTNRIFAFVCLLVCLASMNLSAMNDAGVVEDLTKSVSDKFALFSTAWRATKTLGNAALWTYENKEKVAAAGCVLAVGGAYGAYKMGDRLNQQVKRKAKLAGSISGVAAGGYMLYKYSSNEELKRCMKAGFNTVLTTMATYQRQILGELADIKNMNERHHRQVLRELKDTKNMSERHRELARQENQAAGARTDLLLKHFKIERPEDILDEEVEAVTRHVAPDNEPAVHVAPHIEPVVFEPDPDNPYKDYDPERNANMF